MRCTICNMISLKYKYVCFIATIFFLLLIPGCRDGGELLTIYSAELRDSATMGGLEDIRTELWRVRRNGDEQWVQTKLTNPAGKFEYAFFSVSGTLHHIRISATENPETNCKINIIVDEGKEVHEVKLCKRSDFLLNVSLSEETKLLPLESLSFSVRNTECPSDLEFFSSSVSDDFSKFFEVFPDSKYEVSFVFFNSLDQNLHSGNVEVEIKNEVVELKL